jgi:hypothetical protein
VAGADFGGIDSSFARFSRSRSLSIQVDLHQIFLQSVKGVVIIVALHGPFHALMGVDRGCQRRREILRAVFPFEIVGIEWND